MDRNKSVGCLVAKVHIDVGICAVDVHYVGEWNWNGRVAFWAIPFQRQGGVRRNEYEITRDSGESWK